MISNEYLNRSPLSGRCHASAEGETTFHIQKGEATPSAAIACATIYACRGGEKIAALSFYRSNDHIQIDVIYVKPHCRGQGIGVALVRTLSLHYPMQKYRWEQPAATHTVLQKLLAKALAMD